MSFSTIPILDISLARKKETKPVFLDSLRNALLDVGFLYIKNTGIDASLIQDVIAEGKAFFDLPEEKKLEIQMKNASSFLGERLQQSHQTEHNTHTNGNQGITSWEMKSQLNGLIGGNKLTCQPLTHSQVLQTLSTTIFLHQINGLTPLSYLPSALLMKCISGKCPNFPQNSPP